MTPASFAALHHAAFHDERPWDETAFADLLNDPMTFVVGTAEAAALGRVIMDEAELLTLATHPNQRRQGRARRVLDQFEEAARTRNALTAFVEVRATNTNALALYETSGYVQIGQRKGYYRIQSGARIDAIVLSKQLTSRPLPRF